MLAPCAARSPDAIQEYWQRLAQYDLLKDRFVDIENPQWKDIEKVIARNGRMMWVTVAKSTNEIVGEFQLAGAIGQAAQFHFSVHPEIRLVTKVDILREGSQDLLANEHISALVGLTPFRHAKLILKMAGWECRGVMKGTVKTFKNTYLDAFVMVYQ